MHAKITEIRATVCRECADSLHEMYLSVDQEKAGHVAMSPPFIKAELLVNLSYLLRLPPPLLPPRKLLLGANNAGCGMA